LQDVSFNPNGSIALIVGEEGTVLKYEGYKITELPLKTNYMLSSCSWKNDNEAIIVGARGIIIRYHQDNLSLIPNTISNNLYGTCCYDNAIWIVGERGTILKYKDTFTRIYTDEKEFLIHISFNPKKHYGLILGHGIILRYGISDNLSICASLSVDKKVAVVNEEIILDGFGSTSNGSINNIKSYLFDFGDGTNSGWMNNPAMSVRYSEPGTYLVQLKVKDVYGRESDFDTTTIVVVGKGTTIQPIIYFFVIILLSFIVYFVIRRDWVRKRKNL
jgi:hypothetical protein